jgi:hypothetical protein
MKRSDCLAAEICHATGLLHESVVIHPFIYESPRQNQFLFVLKPELVSFADIAVRRSLISSILSVLDRSGCDYAGCVAIPGPILSEFQVIEHQYGPLDRLSRHASHQISSDEMTRIKGIVGAPPSAAFVGGHEFLKRYPFFDSKSLAELWKAHRPVRINSGFYLQLHRMANESVILVNGFFPAFLDSYYGIGRWIVVLLIHSDLPWKFLRRQVLGDTFPEQAFDGSIRRTLYEEVRRLGLPPIGVDSNCSHLSAGPFEALFEMRNVLERVPATGFHLLYTHVARAMSQYNLASNIESAIQNPELQMHGRSTHRLFTITEEIDTRSAVALYAFHARSGHKSDCVEPQNTESLS